MSGISLHDKAIISIDTLGRMKFSLPVQWKNFLSHTEELERDIEDIIHHLT